MIRAALLRSAEWLVAEDEAGLAVIGDLEELAAEWSGRQGEAIAALRLAAELVCSAPALARIALAGSGPRVALRSIPALLGGTVFFSVLVGTFGAIPSGSDIRRAAAIATVLVFGIASGWITGVLAGRAPRQHGLALGIVLAAACGALAWAAGGYPSPLRPWAIALALGVIPAAAYGGCLRARFVRLRAAGPENA